MKIQLLCDTPDSYIHDYINELCNDIDNGHDVNIIYNKKDIKNGDLLFLLSCSNILSKNDLKKNKHNLVIHPSKLPEGRGGAPLIWKILEGKNRIWFTLFEANENIDEGDVYYQEPLEYKGYELSDEIRYKQTMMVFKLVKKFINEYPNQKKMPQVGLHSHTRPRTPEDSELDINKSLSEQFNLLRVVDNNRYPAFFIFNNHKYILKIYKDNVDYRPPWERGDM